MIRTWRATTVMSAKRGLMEIRADTRRESGSLPDHCGRGSSPSSKGPPKNAVVASSSSSSLSEALGLRVVVVATAGVEEAALTALTDLRVRKNEELFTSGTLTLLQEEASVVVPLPTPS